MSLRDLLTSKYFFLIVGIFVVIRYIGIWHGYPYVYNVDEPTLVKTTLSIRFNPFIDRFDWPHFNYYFHYSFYWIFIKIRGVIQANPFGLWMKDVFPFLWNDPFIFYFLSRFINTTLSIIAAYPIYKIIKKLTQSKTVSRISILVFLMVPYLLFNSRLGIQDAATMTWIAFALYFLLIFIERQKVLFLLLGAVFLALSTGVKYNALLFTTLIPFLSVYGFKLSTKDVVKTILANVSAGILFIIMFVVVDPGIVVYWSRFWSDQTGVGIFWQLNSNLRTYELGEIPKQFFKDATMLFFDLGILPFIGWIISVPFIKKASIESKYKYYLYVLTFFSYLYAINAARYTLSGSRFYLPIYPMVIISSGIVLSLIRSNKVVQVILASYVAVLTLFGIYIAYIFTLPTTLDLALRKYNELSKNHVTYIKAEDMERLNLLNNLKLKTLRSKTVLYPGDYVITGRKLDLESGEIIEIIGKENVDEIRQGRLGSPIYIYEIK